MQCTEWHYRCDACQHRFKLPGADLSFHYGTFLGVSPTPEATFLDAITDLEVMWHNRPVLKFSLGLGLEATKWTSATRT